MPSLAPAPPAPLHLNQEKKKATPPPMIHYFCFCQTDKQPTISYCGVNLIKGLSVTVVPKDLCAVCHDLSTGKVPCPFCGKIPNPVQ